MLLVFTVSLCLLVQHCASGADDKRIIGWCWVHFFHNRANFKRETEFTERTVSRQTVIYTRVLSSCLSNWTIWVVLQQNCNSYLVLITVALRGDSKPMRSGILQKLSLSKYGIIAQFCCKPTHITPVSSTLHHSA